MIGPWTWIQLTNAASGALFIALGVLVARVKGRERANAAFAAFAIAYGAAWLILNLGTRGSMLDLPRGGLEVAALVGTMASLLVAVIALGALAAVFPRPVRRTDLGRLAIAGAVGALHLATLASLHAPSRLNLAGVVADSLSIATMTAACALLALRSADASEAESGPQALMAAALIVHPGFFAGILYGIAIGGRVPGLDVRSPLGAVVFLGPSIAVALLWLRAAIRSPARSRAARNVALLALASVLAGALAVSSATPTGDHWGYGAARTVGVLVLAYAIVRHQLLGIDVKVRWGISRGTIAAAFVAAFFIASEGAQLALGQDNEWFGLAAAGALVFALAPLQRAAERVANAAVPVVSPAVGAAAPRVGSEEAYRAAVRLALRGEITRAEEFELARIAEANGLGPVRALELRDEVERAAASALAGRRAP